MVPKTFHKTRVYRVLSLKHQHTNLKQLRNRKNQETSEHYAIKCSSKVAKAAETI